MTSSMTSITVRKLPTATKERLRVQAARSGISLEAYTRHLLQRAAEQDQSPSPDLATLAKQCFGNDGIELELPPRGQAREPIRFD